MLCKLFFILIIKSQAHENTTVCKSNYTKINGSCQISNQVKTCYVGKKKGITESYNAGINWQPCIKKKYVYKKDLKMYIATYELLGYSFSSKPR